MNCMIPFHFIKYLWTVIILHSWWLLNVNIVHYTYVLILSFVATFFHLTQLKVFNIQLLFAEDPKEKLQKYHKKTQVHGRKTLSHIMIINRMVQWLWALICHLLEQNRRMDCLNMQITYLWSLPSNCCNFIDVCGCVGWRRERENVFRKLNRRHTGWL